MGIDILIPVLNRPQNVQPLMASLQVTQEPYRVIFICSPRDTEQIAACSAYETLIVDWRPGKGDFAKKINFAFDRTDSEWLFQGADDIKFYPGWDTMALQQADKTGKLVIGTNDLHNPLVKRGRESTHTLFARSYIEQQGGTLDNTGRVFCELYDHQFVDLEFCETAKRRGVWGFCRQSIVEHLHPHWGLAEDDATYKKAVRNTGDDHRLYAERMGRRPTKTRDERRAQQAEALAERYARRIAERAERKRARQR